jgi:translocation protein SEC63
LRKPHYHVLLGDSKLDKVIVPPIRITDIPTPSSSTGSVETETREFKLTFPAPPQPNLYSFILHLVSDTCLGTDVALPVMMKVEEPPQITEINGADVEGDDEDDDGISDPEEDSLAGQMALMKGGRVKRSPVRNEYESSEEEGSDTDGEGESGSEEEEEEGEEGGRRLRGREGKAINEDTDSEEE